MSPPQFAKRKDMPMTPESYRRIAKRLRETADDLEAHCTPQTPEEERTLGFIIKNLADYARSLVTWNRRTRDATDIERPHGEQQDAT